jgi:transcriptional regulator with XRE-family HTH domain
MKDNNVLGERIKEALALRKMSANTLAKEIGKTPVAVSNVVTGKSSPSVDVLMAMSKALNVSPAFLLGMDETNNESSDSAFRCPHCGKDITIEIK